MNKPLLGAALNFAGLQMHRNWIIERNRDLEIQDFTRASVLNGNWRELAGAIRGCLAGYSGRLGLHAPFRSLPINGEDPEIRALVNRRLHQALDVCDYLGATQMVIHSPYTPWNYDNFIAKAGARERHAERIQLTLRDVIERAKAINCVLVLENVEDKDPAERVNIVRSFDSSALRTSIDTGHAHYLCHSAGAPTLCQFILAAGDTLEHVHLQDTDGKADWHWNPGVGNIDWKEAFSAFGEIPNKPRLLLEVEDQSRLREGANYLIDLSLVE